MDISCVIVLNVSLQQAKKEKRNLLQKSHIFMIFFFFCGIILPTTKSLFHTITIAFKKIYYILTPHILYYHYHILSIPD